MNWFDRIIGAVTNNRSQIAAVDMSNDQRNEKAVLTSPEWMQNPLFGSRRRIDYGELEPLENDITVSAAISFIINSVAGSEWHIIENDDVIEEIDKDAAISFFNSCESQESFETVLRSLIGDILHYDCGTLVLKFPEYCYDEQKNLIRSDVAPLSMVARDGRSFLIRTDKYGNVLNYYQYSFLHQAATPIKFTQEEIIYIRESPSSRSPYGKAKLEVCKNIIDLMMALQLGHRSAQENSLDPGGVISHPTINDPEKLKRLSMMYNSGFKGEENRKRWLVTGSDVDVKILNSNNLDNSWIPGADFYQMSILSVYRVPKTVLGFTDSSTNRATSISQATNFKRSGVSTLMSLIEEVFTREIVHKYFNKNLLFKFKREIDLGDESIRADVDAKNIASGVRTANELRLRDGLEEIEEEDLPEYNDWDDESGDEWDDEETEDEKIEKAMDQETIEQMTVRAIDDFSKDQERLLLAELKMLYDDNEVIEKSTRKIWIKPSKNRKGHWRVIEAATGEDSLKEKVKEFKDLGDKFKDELKTHIDKLDKDNISDKDKKKLNTIKGRMDTAYKNRDDAKASLSKYREGVTGAKKPDNGSSDKTKIETLKSERDKYQKEVDTFDDKIKVLGEKFRNPKTSSAEKQQLQKDADKFYPEKDKAELKVNETQTKIDKIEYNRDKRNKSPDVMIDPKNRIEGFSDDFILIYETDQKMRDNIFGIKELTRNEYDKMVAKYHKLTNIYGSDKYLIEAEKYQYIVDHRKKAAGIPIDYKNKPVITDSKVFNLKDGITDIGDMEPEEVIQQLKAGGWNFEDASFCMEEDIIEDKFEDTYLAVENGIVYGEYGIYQRGKVLEIQELQINASMQRLGYGRKLMGGVIQTALDKKCNKIVLHSMNVESNRFYRAIGMEETSNKIFEGDAGWMKAYLKEQNNG